MRGRVDTVRVRSTDVTIINASPPLAEAPPTTSPVEAAAADDLHVSPADGVAVLDTTELRWFREGQLPDEVAEWFTCGGAVGLAEQRCDTYRLDGRRDTGAKRRFQETLELKVRRSIGENLVLDDGLAGHLEVWRKWSPAECAAAGGPDVPWVDVDKRVIKRRFGLDGAEMVLTEDQRLATGSGCDVEIVDIRVGEIEAWSFAFAAYGPDDVHRDALITAWRTLRAGGPLPDRFGPFFGMSSGYPEWLALVTSRRGTESSCDLRRR